MSADHGTHAMNAKRRRQHVILGILVVGVILLVAVRFMQPTPGRVLGAAKDSGGSDIAESGTPPARIDVTWPVELRRDLFAGNEVASKPREITAPGSDATLHSDAVRQEAKAKLHLHGIVSGDPSRAMINGRAFVQGESIDGFRLLSVEKRRVTVEKDGVTIELKL